MEVVYEVFAYHSLAIGEEMLLPFPAHSGNLLAPSLHFPDFTLIRQTHQTDKQLEEKFVVFT